MDQLLLAMLSKINQGSQFANVLKGAFTVELTFAVESQLVKIKTHIELKIS
jgi:hypothetical protein